MAKVKLLFYAGYILETVLCLGTLIKLRKMK